MLAYYVSNHVAFTLVLHSACSTECLVSQLCRIITACCNYLQIDRLLIDSILCMYGALGMQISHPKG